MSRPLHILIYLLPFSLGLGSCSDLMPGELEGSVDIAVVDRKSPSSEEYVLKIGKFTTLKKLRTLEGDVLRILGKGELRSDIDEILESKKSLRADLEALIYEKQPQPVDFSGFESGGVIYPEDYHSLNMASIYYHFERAHIFFRDMGVKLEQLPLLYLPTVNTPDHQTLSDNVYYDSILQSFAILEAREYQGLPMGMNQGIAIHEYAHAVFDSQVFGGEDLPWLLAAWLRKPDSPNLNHSLNISRSFNEGYADFFAAARTQSPDFMASSAPEQSAGRTLYPAEPRCFGEELRQSLQNESAATHSPYLLGSIVSAALWEASQGQPALAEAIALGIVSSLPKLGEKYRDVGGEGHEPVMSIELHVNTLADTLDSSVRATACGMLLDRLKLSESSIPSCTGSNRPPLDRRCTP